LQAIIEVTAYIYGDHFIQAALRWTNMAWQWAINMGTRWKNLLHISEPQVYEFE